MAELEINVAHRNAILNATGAVFNAGTLALRSGARPGADAAAAGTLLCTITLPNPAFGTAAAGSVAKAGVWSGTIAATGTPAHYRLINSGATQIREGDAAASPGSGETMILSGLVGGDVIEGGTLTIDTYTIAQPAGDAV